MKAIKEEAEASFRNSITEPAKMETLTSLKTKIANIEASLRSSRNKTDELKSALREKEMSAYASAREIDGLRGSKTRLEKENAELSLLLQSALLRVKDLEARVETVEKDVTAANLDRMKAESEALQWKAKYENFFVTIDDDSDDAGEDPVGPDRTMVVRKETLVPTDETRKGKKRIVKLDEGNEGSGSMSLLHKRLGTETMARKFALPLPVQQPLVMSMCSGRIPRNRETNAKRRAERRRSTLGPSAFVKVMQLTYVNGLMMHFPIKVFTGNLINMKSQEMCLVDENDLEYPVIFTRREQKGWFGHGWKNFSMDHRLEVGDVLVFHLTSPTRFKVYIERANEN